MDAELLVEVGADEEEVEACAEPHQGVGDSHHHHASPPPPPPSRLRVAAVGAARGLRGPHSGGEKGEPGPGPAGLGLRLGGQEEEAPAGVERPAEEAPAGSHRHRHGCPAQSSVPAWKWRVPPSWEAAGGAHGRCLARVRTQAGPEEGDRGRGDPARQGSHGEAAADSRPAGGVHRSHPGALSPGHLSAEKAGSVERTRFGPLHK